MTGAIKEHEAWIAQRCPHDAGSGIRLGKAADLYPDTPDDLMWAHSCVNVEGGKFLGLGRIDVTSGERHTIAAGSADDLAHLTLNGSLLCPASGGCGRHGFIRDGKWVDA